MYISEPKIKAKHIVVFALCLAFMICTLGIGAFANDAVVLNKPVITATETGYDFFVTANGFSGSANVVVAAYGSGGECVEKDVAPMDGDGANLTLSADSRGLDYKVMLLENNLKPICDFLGGVVKPEPKILKLIPSDIVNIDEYGIEYFIDSANSNRKETAKFSADSEFLYNRVSIDKTKLLGFVENGDVIVLKDMDSDDKYDVMEVEHYEYDRIRKTDSDAGEFMLETAGTLRVSDAVFEDLDGSSISFDDLKRYDVIAIMTDTGNVESYGNIRIVRITDSFVEGTVDEMYLRGNQYCIVIDDVEYVLKDDNLVDVGDTGIFYVGINGSIVYCPPKNPNYGYILEGAVSEGSSFSGNIWELKMLVANGDSQETSELTFELAAGGFSSGGSGSTGSSGGSVVPETGVGIYKVRKSYNDTVDDYINDNFSQELNQDGTSFLFDHSTSDLLNPARLVTFELDGSGKIKEIIPVSLCGDDESICRITCFEKDNPNGIYNDKKLGDIAFEDETIVFNISEESADDASVDDIGIFKDGSSYTGFAAYNQYDECNIAVILDSKPLFDTDNGLAIVTKISTGKNSDGEDVTNIFYVQNEEEGDVIIDENSTILNSDCSGLLVGDAFMYTTNGDNKVSEYIIISKQKVEGIPGEFAAVDDFTNSDGNFSADKVKAILGEDTELVLGYILNDMRSVSGKGEIITYNKSEDMIVVPASAYKYTYNAVGRNVVIDTGDFMSDTDYAAQDLIDMGDETIYASPILVRLVDGVVVDIYGSTARIAQ